MVVALGSSISIRLFCKGLHKSISTALTIEKVFKQFAIFRIFSVVVIRVVPCRKSININLEFTNPHTNVHCAR